MLLPDIDFEADVKGDTFAKRVISLDSDGFDVDGGTCEMIGHPEMTVYNYRERASSAHRGLGFQLICNDESCRIKVELRAERWHGSSTKPTVKAYTDEARRMVGPILRTYNNTFGTRIRLRIREPYLGPRPTARTITLIDRFSILANTSHLHPLDWQRFYVFAKECRQDLREEVIVGLLIKRGFDRSTAYELATLFEHLRNFRSLL